MSRAVAKLHLIEQMREAREADAKTLHTITWSVKRMREMKSALQACEEYFESRASAEYFTDSPDACGNEEMRLLVEVQTAIAGLPQAYEGDTPQVPVEPSGPELTPYPGAPS